MKKLYILFLSLCFSLISLYAQSEHTGLSVGMGGGATLGATTEQSDVMRFHGRIFGRYGFIENAQIELGVGLGRLAGDDYSTLIAPVDARLVFVPFYMEMGHPYLYAGAGLLRYVADQAPPSQVVNREENGWTTVIPFGIGFSYSLTEKVAFEVSGGYNLTGTDNLDVTTTDSKNDNYWSILLALTTKIEGGSDDADNDGLTNDEEKQLGTDPKNPDTDGDGLTDGEEVNKYQTNPNKEDSDGDGLTDADEVRKYSTDPNKADTDGDGLKDGDELQKYLTEPTKSDTDNDGLNDGDEVLTYKTLPLKADTDGDGLSDGDEVLKHKTNPLVADSDSGTINDGVEVKRGTNPLDTSDDLPKKETVQLEVGKNFVLEGITFKTASSDITPETEQVLEKVVNTLAENKDIEVEIQGHTDNVGSRSSNRTLSTARAEAVKQYLINKGIDAKRMTTKGFGPTKPIAPNTTDEGKQKNRRIEFVRVK